MAKTYKYYPKDDKPKAKHKRKTKSSNKLLELTRGASTDIKDWEFREDKDASDFQ